MAASENPAAGRYPIAALAIALMLVGVLLPPPLFELYHRLWGLTPGEIGLVFAVYAGSLIPSLLFLGGISDSIGRRRTILLSFAILAIGSLVFAFSDGLVWLIVGRIVQGLGVGIGLGAATAAIREWMHERERGRAGEVTVIALGVGSAFGALLGGSLGQYGAHPLALPFFVHVGLLACGAVAVATVPSCPHLHSAAHSAILAVPRAIRTPFLIASMESFLGWATFALFIALVPAFLARTLALHNLLVGAFVITGVQIGSVAASLAGARLATRPAVVGAMLALGTGVWLLLAAIALHATLLVVAATLIVGAGGGLSSLAGLNVVNAIAPAGHRAETLSAYLVACYVGYSVPAFAVGAAANVFGLFVSFVGAAVILGAIALIVMMLTTERNLRPAAATQ